MENKNTKIISFLTAYMQKWIKPAIQQVLEYCNKFFEKFIKNRGEPKIIGLLTARGAEDWIEPAIKQALEYCDEVIVSVGSYIPALKKIEDPTYEICKKYSGITLLNYSTSKKDIDRGRCDILNGMLKKSRLYSVGNWIWILDVDEFYSESAYKEIKSAIKSNNYNYITVEGKFFLINMQRFLKGSHDRLFKIRPLHILPWYRFKPVQHWSGKFRKVYTLPQEDGIFHYSMLTDLHIRKARWEDVYPDSKQIRWLNKIYRDYDLDSENYWIEKNFELSGIRSCWFNKDFQPDENGRLFKYEGKHPKFIEETELPKIPDFRKKYGFK